MLSAMLLHVVETALPVDLGADFAGRNRRVQDVGHALFLIDYLDDVRSAERTHIEGLAAGRGIERRSVQIYAPAVVAGFDHARAEFLEVAVPVVKTFGHGAIRLRCWRSDLDRGADELPI